MVHDFRIKFLNVQKDFGMPLGFGSMTFRRRRKSDIALYDKECRNENISIITRDISVEKVDPGYSGVDSIRFKP